MSDQENPSAMRSHLIDNLYYFFMLIGSLFTIMMGAVFVLTAIYRFDDFIYVMGLQLAPSQGLIIEMISEIFFNIIAGFVLTLYPIIVVIRLPGHLYLSKGGDDS